VAREEHFPEIVRFLREREWGCVAFTSQLMHAGRAVFPSRLRKRIHVDNGTEYTAHREDAGAGGGTDGEGIAAAVLQTNSGFLYPVFSETLGTSPELPPKLYQRFRRGSLFFNTVMGRAGHVEALERIVPKSPSHRVSYYLMVRDRVDPSDIPEPSEESALAELRLHRATVPDARKLFHLQEGYEREEVLLPGRSFQPQAAFQALKQSIRDQIVLYATLQGQTVAKAATNARGMHYDQIGGVYTEPRYRNRRIARSLMLQLLREIGEAGRGASLFVKKHNEPAIALYRRLGFDIRDDFRISYYLG
jgi:ribosomal protein S18 acetylase RimI-like enzyme